MTEELTVGRLVNTHGIRGEIKVLSHTDFLMFVLLQVRSCR